MAVVYKKRSIAEQNSVEVSSSTITLSDIYSLSRSNIQTCTSVCLVIADATGVCGLASFNIFERKGAS